MFALQCSDEGFNIGSGVISGGSPSRKVIFATYEFWDQSKSDNPDPVLDFELLNFKALS